MQLLLASLLCSLFGEFCCFCWLCSCQLTQTPAGAAALLPVHVGARRSG